MTIAVVDVALCNLRSVMKAVEALGFDPIAARDARALDDATHCIVPGVGNFASAMERLSAAGFVDAIRAFAAANKPVLGICLGMQLLADRGEEGGGARGLGLVPGEVKALESRPGMRIPHVGWNAVAWQARHPVIERIKPDRDFYFVHSYRFVAARDDVVLGKTEYGSSFTSAVARGNVVGVQFHPEKSQKNGLALLETFLDWDGSC